MSDDRSRCGHEGCACTVPGGQEYCSEHCRDAARSGGEPHGCGCGHPACQRRSGD